MSWSVDSGFFFGSELSVFWSMNSGLTLAVNYLFFDSGLTWTVEYLCYGLWLLDCLGQWFICLLVYG